MSLITITQSIGCDGLAVAKRVAEGLNIELFDDMKLKEEAAQKGLLLSVQEKQPGWFARLMGDQPELYRELIESVVLGVASRGQGNYCRARESGVAPRLCLRHARADLGKRRVACREHDARNESKPRGSVKRHGPK